MRSFTSIKWIILKILDEIKISNSVLYIIIYIFKFVNILTVIYISLFECNCISIDTTVLQIYFKGKSQGSMSHNHCVKSVRIRNYSGPHFSAFWLNRERYGLFLRIQSQCGKMRTRITPNNFCAVNHLRKNHFPIQIHPLCRICSYVLLVHLTYQN